MQLQQIFIERWLQAIYTGKRLGPAEKRVGYEASKKAKHERRPEKVCDGVCRGGISQVHSARQVCDQINSNS